MTKNVTSRIKSSIIENTPNRIICFFARPYVAGYSLQSVVDRAHELLKTYRILTTADVLGESADSSEKVLGYTDLYLRTIKVFSEHFKDKSTMPTISLKPSSMVYALEENGTLEIDRQSCEAQIEKIAAAAKSHGVNITIDMEDHNWTNVTLDIFRSLREKGLDNVGTVLQSMLYRTDNDIERLPPNSRIRICTGGVYSESPAIAHQEKRTMKDYLVKYTKKLLDKGSYVEIATHDENTIKKIFKDHIIPEKISPDRFEVQMLMGVPRDKLVRDLISGKYLNYGKKVKVRLYVPFAEDKDDAAKYCKRRLIANPDVMRYGVKAFFGGSEN